VLHKRIPIKDLSTPVEETMVEILDTIDLALSEGRNIYMHCFGSKGRTGTVVGCYLARHGMPGKGALEMIQELRRNIKDDPGHSPETKGQRRMVLEWTKGQ
jgi:protein-tyrosine phosphatase